MATVSFCRLQVAIITNDILEKVTDIIGVPQVEDFIGQSTSIFIPTMNFPYIVHIETMGNQSARYRTKSIRKVKYKQTVMKNIIELLSDPLQGLNENNSPKPFDSL